VFTRDAGIETAAGINELFQRCRDKDTEVTDNGHGKAYALVTNYYHSFKFSNVVGVVRLNGTYFDLMGPGKTKGANNTVVPMMAKSKAILDSAEAAFRTATDLLVMDRFMHWGTTRARIFLVANPDLWKRIAMQQTEPRPVQTIVQPKGTRDFYVLTSGATNDYTCQAIAFAVATAVLSEFAAVSSGKPDAKEPVFFSVGFAADVAKLEAVLMPDRAVQVATFTLAGKTYRVRRCVPGMVAPLSTKRLMPLDALVAVTECPTGGEDLYHFLRQSEAVVRTLRTRGPLATVALARALASGNDFRKEMGVTYAAVQRDVEGCEAGSGEPAPAKSKFPDYDKFNKIATAAVKELTQDYLTDQAVKKAKGARAAAQAQGSAATPPATIEARASTTAPPAAVTNK